MSAYIAVCVYGIPQNLFAVLSGFRQTSLSSEMTCVKRRAETKSE